MIKGNGRKKRNKMKQPQFFCYKLIQQKYPVLKISGPIHYTFQSILLIIKFLKTGFFYMNNKSSKIEYFLFSIVALSTK